MVTQIGLQILPYLPLIFSSNVLTIAYEWSNHLTPLYTLQHPISPQTISEIFRRSYTYGASSFLLSLIGSITTSSYLYLYPIHPNPEVRRLDGYTAAFGILHLFPFSAAILRFVLKASGGKLKDEDEVKGALHTWIRINRFRMVADAGAVVCALWATVLRGKA
jgi:hypothetical protein